ncbi:MAG TPA: hypothetical protein VFX50_19200, partial [Gemmatimonadales bacterium]|nr:hypothetical protein [Gemmatimonadales bacterium]
MSTPRDAFYVGYEPRMPAPLARFLRPRLTLLLAGVALAAVALAASLPMARGGRWEYGVVREY